MLTVKPGALAPTPSADMTADGLPQQTTMAQGGENSRAAKEYYHTFMATYGGIIRSNYFKVKDDEAFLEWADNLDLSVSHKQEDGKNSYAIYDGSGNSAGWPGSMIDDYSGHEDEVDFKGELAEHLQEGSVAVLMEVGSESLRYLLGHAVALNSKGESVVVNLDDIYEVAAHLGSSITRAEY